jgi:hypothetical protein
VKGIEPSCVAWEATVLPLNYTRVWYEESFRQFAERNRFEERRKPNLGRHGTLRKSLAQYIALVRSRGEAEHETDLVADPPLKILA